MRALILRPDPTEMVGLVGLALEKRGFELDELVIVPMERYETPDVTVELPPHADYDLIVLLGAPWGAWDDATIGPWLGDVLDYLRQAADDDKPVLGICFGGQALARALGGSVAPGPVPEIGWTDVQSDRDDIVPSGRWFQWHYDRFQPPADAVEIARNAVASQAFVRGRALGTQFHPELDLAELTAWLDLGGHGEAKSKGYEPQDLVDDTVKYVPDGEERTDALVEGFLRHVARLL
jgi:GMP synthase-like glutamine amidotransferase